MPAGIEIKPHREAVISDLHREALAPPAAGAADLPAGRSPLRGLPILGTSLVSSRIRANHKDGCPPHRKRISMAHSQWAK